jgi:hypothetical protein
MSGGPSCAVSATNALDLTATSCLEHANTTSATNTSNGCFKSRRSDVRYADEACTSARAKDETDSSSTTTTLVAQAQPAAANACAACSATHAICN